MAESSLWSSSSSGHLCDKIHGDLPRAFLHPNQTLLTLAISVVPCRQLGTFIQQQACSPGFTAVWHRPQPAGDERGEKKKRKAFRPTLLLRSPTQGYHGSKSSQPKVTAAVHHATRVQPAVCDGVVPLDSVQVG